MNVRNSKQYRIKNKARFRELYYFSLQYHELKKKLAEISVIGSPNNDGLPKGYGVGNPTERLGIEQADLISKVRMIEECAAEADPSISRGILKAVTTPNCTYNWLSANGWLYCGRDKFYQARQKYYWLLDQRKG